MNGMNTNGSTPPQGVIYETIWRAKWTTDGATTIGEMIEQLLGAAKGLREMEAAGIMLDQPVDDDYAYLVTDDAAVAKEFGLTPRQEDEAS